MNNANFSKQIIIQTKIKRLKFSKGLLAQFLFHKKIEHKKAYKIATEVQNSIYSMFSPSEEEVVNISEKKYFQIIKAVSSEILEEKIYEKLKIILEWHISHQPLIIMLAGGKGCGKKEIGKAIADKFSLSHIISTSTIVQILRKTLTPELAPELHETPYKAYKKLKQVDSLQYDEVLFGFIENSKYVTGALEALIQRALMEGINLLIRGEHLIPPYISHEILLYPNVVFIALSIPDERLHLKRLLLETEIIEEDEIISNFSAMRKISGFLDSEFTKREIKIVQNVGSVSSTVEKVSDIIIHRLDKLNEHV